MKTLFLCDFDGTATKKDFYHIVIDEWIGEAGREYMIEYQKKKPLDYHFLNLIFRMKPMSKQDYCHLVQQIEPDPHLKSLIETLARMGIDFALVSAGCLPYIEDTLTIKNITGIPVITNHSKQEDGTLIITPDPTSPFFAEPFGIDKAAVVRHYKKYYERIIFAGDSLPDLGAAKEADLVFATGSLRTLLHEEGTTFIPFKDFLQVITYLEKENVS